MYYELRVEPGPESIAEIGRAAEGRFVLHRHTDAGGEHMDLRIEDGEVLRGWRVDATTLEDAPWATEKAPHPLHWLHEDAPAERVDAGHYAWESRSEDGGTLVLEGASGCRRVHVKMATTLAASTARAIWHTAEAAGIAIDDVPTLLADGAAARTRAIERLCGLGRELDDVAFDSALGRKSVSGMSLDEIHRQLRAYETRFDAKYPPQRVSQPVPLPDEDQRDDARSNAALAIVRG